MNEIIMAICSMSELLRLGFRNGGNLVTELVMATCTESMASKK